MGKNWYIILVILLMGITTALSFSQVKVPLPSDISIIPPDPSLPEEIRCLSGKWAGQWDSKFGWDCVISVEKVDRESARIVHSWGEYDTAKGSCHCAPDWRRVRMAKVTYSEGKATLEFYSLPYHRPLKESNIKQEISGMINPNWRASYFFTFTVEKSLPDIMKGHFVSGKNSHLFIEMKKID